MNRNVKVFSKKESDDVDGDKIAALMTSIDEIPFDDEMLHDAHSILVLLLITKEGLLEWESPGPRLNDRGKVYLEKAYQSGWHPKLEQTLAAIAANNRSPHDVRILIPMIQAVEARLFEEATNETT